MSKEKIFTVQDWTDYIEGRMNGNQAILMERYLQNEPHAMEEYLAALGTQRDYPVLPNPEEFTETVMSRIVSLPSSGQVRKVRSPRSERNRRWFEHRVFHYAVAACLTLIFLSSGLFDKVMPYHQFQEDDTAGTFTEKWTEAATSWLDQFKPKP